MDVVVDTDVLSTLTKVGKTALLQQLFPKSNIILCPSVQSEISKAVKLGILDSAPANFSQVELTQSEKNVAKEIGGRTSLGGADIECLAVSKSRDCLLLSNDKQVGNEAISLGVERLSLPMLLREFWKAGILQKAEVARLADEIERKDRIVIRNKHLLLS
jgi:predicted nucleic acid-binding protein